VSNMMHGGLSTISLDGFDSIRFHTMVFEDLWTACRSRNGSCCSAVSLNDDDESINHLTIIVFSSWTKISSAESLILPKHGKKKNLSKRLPTDFYYWRQNSNISSPSIDPRNNWLVALSSPLSRAIYGWEHCLPRLHAGCRWHEAVSYLLFGLQRYGLYYSLRTTYILRIYARASPPSGIPFKAVAACLVRDSQWS
jgi:hypothetical protein